MMKEIWTWIKKNSTQLQGTAAIIAIIAGLGGVYALLSTWFQSDITIKVETNVSTIPPELKDWLEEAIGAIGDLKHNPNFSRDSYPEISKLQLKGPFYPDGNIRSWYLAEPSRLKIEIINETDRVISGARLRLDRADPMWGIELAATFLTSEEINTWKKGLSGKQGSAVVLPELPPIPPQSAVKIVAYGDVANADVLATVPGSSFTMIPIVMVENKWPISMILEPTWLPIFIWLLLVFFMFLNSLFNKIYSRNLIYDLACDEAKAGREDSAVGLLRRAIEKGFVNFDHMKIDPDLDGLRNNPEFKKMIGT